MPQAAEIVAQHRIVRPGRGIAKEVREVCNYLIDEHCWRYLPNNHRGGHPRICPPDKSKTIVNVPNTPSDWRAFQNWLRDLRASGAQLTGVSPENSVETVSAVVQDQGMVLSPQFSDNVSPISTVGAWWRPVTKPKPEPEPTPVLKVESRRVAVRSAPRALTPAAPSLDPKAEGTVYSLSQARTMLRQGYHVNKVIARTGWGSWWLSDLVDPTGFYRPEAALSEVQG